MSLKLCKRCNNSFDDKYNHDICTKCFCEINEKYCYCGEIPTPEQMDYIEEVDQLSDFYFNDRSE